MAIVSNSNETSVGFFERQVSMKDAVIATSVGTVVGFGLGWAGKGYYEEHKSKKEAEKTPSPSNVTPISGQGEQPKTGT